MLFMRCFGLYLHKKALPLVIRDKAFFVVLLLKYETPILSGRGLKAVLKRKS